ncbi:MAG TPA: class II aldolase/adducin family protein [Vitreimonas sp.]|nr:class II aldolase/adducin family protein [Vitreimonas sp.]
MEARPPAGLLEQAVHLARRFGSDAEFARGGGGNVSAKADGVLWIKPSGVSLAGLTPEALMPLDMGPLLAMLAPDAADEPAGSDPVLRVGMAARLRPTDDRRPSVECLFHALLPEPIVVHTHPTIVNVLACSVRGAEVARQMFGDGALWIPYTDPGLPLARRIADERRAFEATHRRAAPPVLLLQSHGLIVSGSKPGEIAARSDAVVAAIRDRLQGDVSLEPAGEETVPDASDVADGVARALGKRFAADGRAREVVLDRSPLARWIGGTAAGRSFVEGGPLTPDQIVYAGSSPLLVDAASDVAAALERPEAAVGEPASLVIVPGLGLIGVGDTPSLATTAVEVYLDAARVARGAARLGGARPMTPSERRFIEQWEAEAYRRGIEAADRRPQISRGGRRPPSGGETRSPDQSAGR